SLHDEPKYHLIWKQGTGSKRVDIGTVEDEVKFQPGMVTVGNYDKTVVAFSSTLWAIRKAIGAYVADRLIYKVLTKMKGDSRNIYEGFFVQLLAETEGSTKDTVQ